MIVEIPECNFRIFGNDPDWQIQFRQKRGENGESWNGKYFYPHLEYAVMKAYELMLMKSDAVVQFADVPAECEKVKKQLVTAVKRALKESA